MSISNIFLQIKTERLGITLGTLVITDRSGRTLWRNLKQNKTISQILNILELKVSISVVWKNVQTNRQGSSHNQKK